MKTGAGGGGVLVHFILKVRQTFMRSFEIINFTPQIH